MKLYYYRGGLPGMEAKDIHAELEEMGVQVEEIEAQPEDRRTQMLNARWSISLGGALLEFVHARCHAARRCMSSQVICKRGGVTPYK